MPQVEAAAVIVLAGREAIALHDQIEKQFAACGRKAEMVVVDSILEAVLMSGGGTEDRPAEVPLVVAGVAQELEQIEPAVRSMRKVYAKAKIVLVCEPGDEVDCRKAKGWGANDYLILPADAASLLRLCAVSDQPPATSSSHPATESGSPSHRIPAPGAVLKQVVEVQAGHGEGVKLPIRAAVVEGKEEAVRPAVTELPGLPLMVQTALLSDLLNGRPDFAERVVATLQSYVKWNGKLRYVAGESSEAAGANELRRAVALPDQAPFGTLALESSTASASGAVLGQAAHWLATLLSISKRYEQLRSLAITDELSGAYNRRYFAKFMSGLLERARTNRFRVTLLLFDIDDFKKYNDTFGHASGDAIIRELIKLLRACTRPHDLVARIGGDEFAVVYWDNEAPRQPNSEHPKDVLSATERFRKAIKEHKWPEICKIQGDVSISGGLATFPWDADTLEALMARADEALLRAKAAGKNAIHIHGGGCEGGGEEAKG